MRSKGEVPTYSPLKLQGEALPVAKPVSTLRQFSSHFKANHAIFFNFAAEQLDVGNAVRVSLTDMQSLQEKLSFTPEFVSVWVYNRFEAVAEHFGLSFPFRTAEGSVEVLPGYTMTYLWGSIDGRGTDYLRLAGVYDANTLPTLLESIQTHVPVRYPGDVELIVSSRPSPT